MEGLSGVVWSSLLTRSWKGVFWISLYRQLSDSNKRGEIINRFSQVAMPNNVCCHSYRISSPNGGSIHSHVKLHPFSILGFIPDCSLSGESSKNTTKEKSPLWTNPGHTRGSTYSIWPGKASGSPWRSRRLDSPAATTDKDGCTDKKKQILSVSPRPLWNLSNWASGIGTLA